MEMASNARTRAHVHAHVEPVLRCWVGCRMLLERRPEKGCRRCAMSVLYTVVCALQIVVYGLAPRRYVMRVRTRVDSEAWLDDIGDK